MSAKAATETETETETERTHKYYIANYINKGSSKVVFSSAFSPRTSLLTQGTDKISLSIHQLNNIYIELDSALSINFDKIVVACIITSSIEKQRECIENIRLQQLFFSNNMATKIYGIVIMEEKRYVDTPAIKQKPNNGSKYNEDEWTTEPVCSYHYTYHRWNMADDIESGVDTFLSTAQTLLENGLKKTFFVFQERCDFDVVEYVKNEIKKTTRNLDCFYPIKPEFIEKIDHYMSIHVKKYIKHGYIDTDYKPGNVCILHSDGLDSVFGPTASSAASSAHAEQTWKSFDFDIKFVHDIKGFTPFCIEDAQYATPSSLITAHTRREGVLNEKKCNTVFKQNCKLYMIIQFYVTFSYIVVSYREYFVPIISEILQTKHKITKKTINDIVYYFYNINTYFIEQYTTEYNTDIYTPYISLLNYASLYFTKNILNTLVPVEQERIMDEQKHKTPQYLVIAICAIFGFVGTPKSSPVSSPVSSPKSLSVPMSVHSPKSRKSSEKSGGRKVNSSKKHLNKRASTNTNAITKKSKSKRTLVK